MCSTGGCAATPLTSPNRDLADPDAEGYAPRARTVGHQATSRGHMQGYAPMAALPAFFREGVCLSSGICFEQYFLLRRSGHSFCCVSCRSGGFPLRRRKRANKNNLTHFFFLFYFIPHVSVGLWGRVFCARGKTWFRGPTPKKSEDDGVLAQEPPPGCQAQTGGCAGGQGAPPQTGKGSNVIWGELGASRRVHRPVRGRSLDPGRPVPRPEHSGAEG